MKFILTPPADTTSLSAIVKHFFTRANIEPSYDDYRKLDPGSRRSIEDCHKYTQEFGSYDIDSVAREVLQLHSEGLKGVYCYEARKFVFGFKGFNYLKEDDFLVFGVFPGRYFFPWHSINKYIEDINSALSYYSNITGLPYGQFVSVNIDGSSFTL